MKLLLLALALTSCGHLTCDGRVQVSRYPDPATGGQVVTVRCRDTVLASRACLDGGAVIVGPREARVYCDGSVLVRLPADVSEVLR